MLLETVKVVCARAAEPAVLPIGLTNPVGETGPERMTTVLGSGRLARLSRTVPRFRSIWRDRPTHSSLLDSKTYDVGRLRPVRTRALFTSLRSVVNPERRRA